MLINKLAVLDLEKHEDFQLAKKEIVRFFQLLHLIDNDLIKEYKELWNALEEEKLGNSKNLIAIIQVAVNYVVNKS